MLPYPLVRILLEAQGKTPTSSWERNYREAVMSHGLTPIEYIEHFLNEARIDDINIRHSSSRNVMPEMLPCAIFFEGSWQLLEQDGDGFLISSMDERNDGAEQRLNELPTTVAIWLSKRRSKYADDIGSRFSGVLQIYRFYTRRNYRWIAHIALATVIINIFALITGLYAMQVYDRVVPSLAFATLTTLSVGVIAIYVFDWLLKTTRAYILDKNSSNLDLLTNHLLYQKLVGIQLDKLPRQLGTLTAQLGSTDSVKAFFTSSVVYVLIDMPFAALFLTVIYAINAKIAAVYLALLVVCVLIAVISQARNTSLQKTIMTRSNEKMGLMVDSIRGIETIKSTGTARYFANDWNDVNHSIKELSLRQKTLTSTSQITSIALGSAGYVAAIVVGVNAIAAGELTMGSLIACSILGGKVLGPVGQVVSYANQFGQAKQAVEIIDKFLSLPGEREQDSLLVLPTVRPSNIQISGLTYKYESAKTPVLSIEQLTFSAGERVALLGSIGSGKSTLLKLLAGLIKPTEGQLRVDGADLWEIDPFFLHQQFCYLPQFPDLFRGTLRQNITLGRNLADDKLLYLCSRIGIETFLKSNGKGFDYEIYEGGQGLSGGQRQLVGLARAFATDPAVILLDEPMASVDTHHQNQILEFLTERCTTDNLLVFSTHNIEQAMKLATRIIVLESGKILKDVPKEAVEVRKRHG